MLAQRVRQALYSSCHTFRRRVMVVAENPAALEPRSASNASEKSPVDKPFKYRTGTASSRRGERRI